MSEHAELFRAAWHAADERGEKGRRVDAGLAAVAPLMKADALRSAAVGFRPPSQPTFTGDEVADALEEVAANVLRVASALAVADDAELLPDEVAAAVLVQPCPECRAGKHGNCDGGSWDFVEDVSAPCPCSAAGHGEPTFGALGDGEPGYEVDPGDVEHGAGR